MAKKKTVYVCQSCGYKSPTWSGRCPQCGKWGTFVEEVETGTNTKISWIDKKSEVLPISSIGESCESRFETAIRGFDNLSGGGLVKGSVCLLSGEPGIGKSTFLLQLSNIMASYGKVLYVTAEESAEQIGLRARRLGIKSSGLFVLAENNLDVIAEKIKRLKPVFAVFDSIQTLYVPYIESAAGSVSQVRESASFITRLSKTSGITSFIVGHVNKEGNIAGPKVLEHIVDAVFQFEGDKGYNFRILSSQKNRFGSTGEVAVFEMRDSGLFEVPNPSEFFLSERPEGKPGSVIFSGIEGTRPMLLEIQALVTRAAFTTPQRRAKGVDLNRLSLIVAILEKELGYPLRNFDVFVNVVGGVKVSEPAVDLAVALAIASSYTGKPIMENLAVFGEMGLTGEVRRVKLEREREKEAAKNNFEVLKNVKNISEAVARSLGGNHEPNVPVDRHRCKGTGNSRGI